MGEHRREDGRRRVSKGPVIAGVALILVIALVIGWLTLRSKSRDEAAAAAAACVEGSATIEIAADPDIAGPLSDIVKSWTATSPVVRDKCIGATVTGIDSAAVARGLTAQSWDSSAGPKPALWVPSGSTAAATVVDKQGAVEGATKSLASSPVVLAVPTDLSTALGAAATGWSALPGLTTGTNTLDAIGLAGWGSLRLALPSGAGSAATTEAVTAVAAAAAGSTGSLTADQVGTPAVRTAVSTLVRAAADTGSNGTADVLKALGGERNPASGPVQAVAATEQQVFAARLDGSALTAFRPAGDTPVADHPAVILADADETIRAAAAQFVEYALAPDQQQVLGRAGFRVAGPDGQVLAPASSSGLEFLPVTGLLARPSATAVAALQAVIDNPVSPTTTTIVLDISGSMDSNEGSGTRLRNTTAALTSAIAGMPDAANVGLWVFSRNLDGANAYRVLEPTAPLSGGGKRAALAADLTAVRPATATSTYVSVEAAYKAAVANWTPGRSNSVILITDGPNDDTSISSSTFLADIKTASSAAKPVRVDVVSLASNSDLATLTSLATSTSGELVQTRSSDASYVGTLGRLLSKSP